MLNYRYKNNREPLIHLNQAQLEMKKSVEKKVSKGVYKFKKHHVVFVAKKILSLYHIRTCTDFTSCCNL